MPCLQGRESTPNLPQCPYLFEEVNMTRAAFLYLVAASWCLSGWSVLNAADPPKVRLFILSGQSNMAGLDPDVSFTPAVKAAFPGDDVLVVKSAQGGQPIRRWFKGWKPPEGSTVKTDRNGDLYDTLVARVKAAVGNKKPDVITFVWMQGERDAREGLSTVYQASLRGLVEQLRADLGRKDISVVVGRLSDFDTKSNHWKAVREAQVAYAESDPLAAWVDTDDLNGDKNDLHYTKEGYAELGRRFAARAVELQKKTVGKK
jgi:hypothetical protein